MNTIKTPNPIAPDCKVRCPQVETEADGSETYSYCADCASYLTQNVDEQNAIALLGSQDRGPSLS
jgi:hypothetical protein